MIDKLGSIPVVESLFAAARRSPEHIAIVDGSVSVSYAELADAVQRATARLNAIGGVRRSIALVIPSSLDLAVWLFGGWSAGWSVTLQNAALNGPELQKLWDKVRPDLVITRECDVERLRVYASCPVVACEQSDWKVSLSRRPRSTRHASHALYLGSGGTTGFPKAVAHSHSSIWASVKIMAHGWPTTYGQERWVSVAPQFHIYGLLISLLCPIEAGATNILQYPFRPALTLDLLRNWQATVFSGGPAALYEALLAAGITAADVPKLHICAAGGASLPRPLLDRWLQTTGVPIEEAYGMTEMAPITANGSSVGNRPGTVGKAGPGTAIEIRCIETGANLADGSEGMIVACGPQMMSGYVGNESENAAAMLDGWLITGDIGRLDAEGYLEITGRAKEMINVSGFKVYPREVEEAARLIDGIIDACALGVPDAKTGETVLLCIVASSAEVDREAVIANLSNRLVRYKQPAHIVTLREIPKTAANKPDRASLLRDWMAGAFVARDPTAA